MLTGGFSGVSWNLLARPAGGSVYTLGFKMESYTASWGQLFTEKSVHSMITLCDLN